MLVIDWLHKIRQHRLSLLHLKISFLAQCKTQRHWFGRLVKCYTQQEAVPRLWQVESIDIYLLSPCLLSLLYSSTCAQLLLFYLFVEIFIFPKKHLQNLLQTSLTAPSSTPIFSSTKQRWLPLSGGKQALLSFIPNICAIFRNCMQTHTAPNANMNLLPRVILLTK